MKLSCNNARSLVPSYLDGELSEEQSAPLRQHLLGCPGCREAAKDGKSLKRWFTEAARPDVLVPQGFAAHVARRAFAGDTGQGVAPGAPVHGEREEVLMPFVLRLCAVAAGLLFCFSIAIQRSSLPEGSGLDAQYRPPWEKEAPVDVRLQAPKKLSEDEVEEDEEE